MKIHILPILGSNTLVSAQPPAWTLGSGRCHHQGKHQSFFHELQLQMLCNPFIYLFSRLQQLDKHCQATAQQLVELLNKQNQLFKEKHLLTEEVQFLRTQVLCQKKRMSEGNTLQLLAEKSASSLISTAGFCCCCSFKYSITLWKVK